MPARDDHLSTTAYARVGSSALRDRDERWTTFELASVHDLRGGAVLAIDARADVREATTVEGSAVAAIPLPKRFWVVPTLRLSGGSHFAPEALLAAELRSDRTRLLGYSAGVEGSTWSEDRKRIQGVLGGVLRIGPTALEQRLALGAWIGPHLGGDLVGRWSTSALQLLGKRFALFERVTFTRGPAYDPTGVPRTEALSVDVSVGFRHPLGDAFGFVVQAESGMQPGWYTRSGFEVTLYGTLF